MKDVTTALLASLFVLITLVSLISADPVPHGTNGQRLLAREVSQSLNFDTPCEDKPGFAVFTSARQYEIATGTILKSQIQHLQSFCV